jgi:hypothetical protein
MIGGNHSGVLVTHVDKASKFLGEHLTYAMSINTYGDKRK